MQVFIKQHRFINFLLFALLGMVINLLSGYLAGYATTYSTTIYCVCSTLLLACLGLYKAGHRMYAKVLSTLLFNAFFFALSHYYGLRGMIFIYYFPFFVSYIYLYKEDASAREARLFAITCFAFLIAIFVICPMNGSGVLTPNQEVIMYKKNFMVAFALSAYYFNEIFSSLMVQMRLAQEASASKARFLSIMSHELRTPLNGIIGAINLSSVTTDENEKQKLNDVLKSSSEHLLHLVNNVLDYSKASSGKMQLNPLNTSVGELLLNLKEIFQNRFDEKDLALEVLMDEEVNRNVLLDDVRFVQVLTNLLSNALKFTDSGKVVLAARCINITNSTMELEVSVNDTGAGLTGEQQESIFDSFNNVSNKSAKVESSGLGLSICKMIVEMMGGSLLVESNVKTGSKFYFIITLPLAPAKEKPVVIINNSNSLEGVKILVAEDNAINMMIARQFLKRWKVVILEASNGLIAQQLLVENPDIDLLLLDLQMPVMDGYELMDWIRKNHIDLPVLAFTAQIMATEAKYILLDRGFTDMIPKPFAPEELQEKLQSALRHKLPAKAIFAKAIG
jgi:signal transduction histidine kinase